MATRWGICSAGRIANDFVRALKLLPTTDHQGMWTRCFPGYQTIREVLKSGQLGRVNCLMGAFCVRGYRAKEPTDVLKDLGCYLVQYAWLAYPELPDRVIAVKKSEVVYVSNIDKLHYSSCDLFLDHGKHVLCEKPVSETREQCQRLVDKARDKKLFFMEGMWTRCFPGYQTIREVLKSGQLGRVNCLMGAFCIPGDRAEEPTDVLKDLGCYLVQYAWLAYPELPDKVIAVKKSGEDLGVSMLLDYKDGGMAAFYVTVRGQFGADFLTFYGTEGNLQIHEVMHNPIKMTLPDGSDQDVPIAGNLFCFLHAVGRYGVCEINSFCPKHGSMPYREC